jgi:hypothetical protein
MSEEQLVRSIILFPRNLRYPLFSEIVVHNDVPDDERAKFNSCKVLYWCVSREGRAAAKRHRRWR